LVFPAQALNNQSFVSGTGSNTNDCATVATACAGFVQAMAVTNPGGEITVVNTGDYGPVAIGQSVNITNDGAGEASILVGLGGVGIFISAGVGDVASLRGLVLDGQIIGNIGIDVTHASAVHIQNCVIRNWEGGGGGYGIAFIPSSRSQLFISDTIVFNNGSIALTGGILIEPQAGASADVVLDRVHLGNNVDGLLIDGAASGPGSHVIVRDSMMSGNAANGIHALTIPGMSPAFALVERSTMVNNGQNGILADGPGATVLLKESTIARNGTGVSTVNSGPADLVRDQHQQQQSWSRRNRDQLPLSLLTWQPTRGRADGPLQSDVADQGRRGRRARKAAPLPPKLAVIG